LAKRDSRHPALRGEQVQRWLQSGILKAEQLGNTPILVVREATRVRLTPKYRTTLGQGIFLVPRWVKIPWHRWTAGLRNLSAEELEARAIIISSGGLAHRLIYQMVEDLDHLCRQQRHILDRGVGRNYFERRIQPYIVKRKRAALALRQTRRLQLAAFRGGRIAPLGHLLKRPERITPELIEQMLLELDRIINELDEIIERPLVTRRKRAQRSLRAAQRWIEEENFTRALKHLRAAWENLTWPKDKEAKE
jgi:hypothetical protein